MSTACFLSHHLVWMVGTDYSLSKLFVANFLFCVGEYSHIADKSLARTLMSTLTTMKFDGSCTMQEHVIEMTNIATRLKTLFNLF